jgi:thiol:disulfide interchange protein
VNKTKIVSGVLLFVSLAAFLVYKATGDSISMAFGFLGGLCVLAVAIWLIGSEITKV